MDEVLKILAQYGAAGAIVAVLLYMIYTMQGKLFSVIENNTKALEQLRGIIEKCQLTHHASD